VRPATAVRRLNLGRAFPDPDAALQHQLIGPVVRAYIKHRLNIQAQERAMRAARKDPQPMPVVYLSGPMTGLPELNFPAFHAQADRLRLLGYEVVNPAEINPDAAMPWNECMRADIKALCDCDVIALLPGWGASTGAHLELHIAHRIGIQVRMVDEL
jgi:hypothetical protein